MRNAKQALPARPLRARVHHPLEIRSWVVGKTPGQILDTLTARATCLMKTVEPYQEWLGRYVDLLRTHASLLNIQPSPTTEGGLSAAACTLASQAIARYWWVHPYPGPLVELHRAKYLPPIVFNCAPPEVRPEEIHVLDLDLPFLKEGASGGLSGPLPDLPPEPSAPSPSLDFLIEWAIADIRFSHGQTSSFFHPVVFHVLTELLKTAHFSPHRENRKHAVAPLKDLFSAFMPDLSQHVSRRVETLLPRLDAYEGLVAELKPLHRRLQDEGLTRVLLAAVRDRINPRVTMADLRAWRVGSLSEMAITILAGREGLSPKTLTDQLTLARKARGIQDAWDRFRACHPLKVPGLAQALLGSPQ